MGGFLASAITIDTLYQVWKKLVVTKPITTQSDFLSAFIILIGIWFSYFIIMILIISAHRFKRCLFFYSEWDCSDIVIEKDQESKNVYQIEDRLFDLLRKGKPREFPVVHVAGSLALFLIGSSFIIFTYLLDLKSYLISGMSEPWITYYEQYLILRVVIYIGFYGCAIFFIANTFLKGIGTLQEGFGRKWR